MLLPDPRERPTLTVEEAARIVGVSRSSAYEAARTGELPVIRVGRRVLIPTARLLAMLGVTADPTPAADGDADGVREPVSPPHPRAAHPA